ncbi:hypothetical protein V8E53_011676 [Lactarius tabidus]
MTSHVLVLVALDWLMSASLGQPCAIQEEEYVGSFQIVLSSESHDFVPALTLNCPQKLTTNTGRTRKSGASV